MSWQDYISNMQASGLVYCGIYGQDGNVWVKSPELNASVQEVAALVAAIKANDVAANKPGFPDGVMLNGIKHTVIGYGPDFVTAKGSTVMANDEKFLLHAGLAKTCVVLGLLNGAGERGVVKIVDGISDYLAKNNY